jgi:hypothetical protein
MTPGINTGYDTGSPCPTAGIDARQGGRNGRSSREERHRGTLGRIASAPFKE